jgi:adenylate cyclase
MAFWNAPLDVYNHEIKACIAAKEMHKKINELNEELIIENKLPIEAGIGINSGIGLVGNVGSTQRFDYSVIGDTVNLAARLESQSKIYGFPTLVSEFVAKNDTSNSFIEIDKIRVKGKNNPVKIFILKDDISNDPNDAIFNEIDNFLKNYRLQKWNESKINLLKIHEESPICKVYCKEFLKRINYYNDISMDKNWDGVYVATTK